jgi:hypothetical protein
VTIETQNHEIMPLSDTELDKVTGGDSPGLMDYLVGLGEAELYAESYVKYGLHKAAETIKKLV